MPPSRREFIQSMMLAGSVNLAGCSMQQSAALTSEDVAFDVQRLASFEDDHPARLRISLTNAGSAPFTIEGGGPHPFDDHVDTSGELFLIPDNSDDLVPTGENREQIDVPLVPEARMEGCWTAAYNDVMWQEPAIIKRLEPDETFEQSYTLVDAPSGSCLPRESYRFRETRTILQEESSYQVTLAFTITVPDQRLDVSVDKPSVSTAVSN